MIQKNIAIINTHSPYSNSNAKEALDLAMIFGSYEQKVSLFFQGEGIWQLVAQQMPESIHSKDFLKTMSALEFYDIENIYACQNSIEERQLLPHFHLENVNVLSPNAFIEKLHNNHVIYKF